MLGPYELGPDGENAGIYTGDARELAKAIPDESVDLVFTSPPFKDEDVAGDYWQFYDSLFRECMRVCRKATIIIHSATKINDLMVRYPPKRLMIWGKGISQYSWRYNPILVYQKSDAYKVNKYIWSDIFGVNALFGNDKFHPYQDPDTLYWAIIGMFKDCDIVLDPCIGSGTTAIACNYLGRKWIGFEKDCTMADIARKRVRETQPPLFTLPPVQLPLEVG